MTHSDDFTILTINSAAQWKAQHSAADTLLVQEEGLTLRSFYTYTFARTIGKPEGLLVPTDLAVDDCGQLFILDGQQSRIAIYDPQQARLEWIECIGGVGHLPTQMQAPEALALSARTLYVADTGNHRVLAFARLNWQLRWVGTAVVPISSPPDVWTSPPELALPMVPCDLAVDADDNLYVLDRANRLVHQLAPGGQSVRTIGQGLLVRPVTIALDTTSRGDIACLVQHLRAGTHRQRHAASVVHLLAITYNKMSSPEQAQLRTFLATISAGNLEEQLRVLQEQLQAGVCKALDLVEMTLAPYIARYQTILYVLDAALKRVLRFTGTGEFLGVALDLGAADVGFLEPFGLALDQQGDMYLGERRSLRAGQDEDRFIYRFDASGYFVEPPITAYRGRTDGLVSAPQGNLYVLNGEREDITVLQRQERFPLQGVSFSAPFDSTIDDCRWHKLVMTATLPAKTRVSIAYHVDNTVLPPDEVATLPPSAWSTPPLVNAPDALILGRSGRYLWLRMSLDGDGQAAPILHNVQVYFQRTSYLRYLPAIYQEDETSRAFLERFLSLFETLFHNLDGQIGHLARTFDPLAAPEVFLPWLAQWLAVTLDAHWPADKQRQLLQHAAELYKARGTRRGFEDIIALLTGEKPIIFEYFQLQCIQDEALRQVYEKVFGNDPFHFCVLLKPNQIQTDRDYFAVKRLVEADKPAHTHAGVRWLQQWLYLDMHTYLGVNTYLPKPEMRLEQQSVIGRDSVLTDVDEAGQVERRSRVGMDTALT